jgi:hypothetical protein
VRQAEQRQKDEEGSFPYLNIGAFPVAHGRSGEPLDTPEGVRWGTIWDRVSLSPAAEWRLTQFCLAMGLKVNSKGEIVGSLELDEGKPGTIIKKRALLRVKGGSNLEGEYRAEAGAWSPYEPTDTGEGFEDEESVGDDEASEEEADAFGDDGDGDEEYYTAESLSELDNDGLKDAAGEFDLDVKDYVVKVRGKTNVPKTRDAIIEAILEAQGVEDNEEDDEEPF